MKFEKKEKDHIPFILYDSILNSVFKSQVLTPLLTMLAENKNIKITLISFEKEKPPKKLIDHLENRKRFHLIICKRLPFFGKLSLYFALFQLKNLLKKFPSKNFICRGPLAGWIALKALKHKKNEQKTTITIQVRGLCAQEYRFATQQVKENILKRLLQKFIFKRLEKVERQTFGTKKGISSPNITIESVSPALSTYIIKNFETDPHCITLATKDIPKPIDLQKKKKWRKEIRKKLKIGNEKSVYCYSGSTKPWQCLPQTIAYFAKAYASNANNFLLLLSNDTQELEHLIKNKNLPEKRYLILRVEPEELQKYLCACDFGFLFRDKDIINWVSRPTKMLEYQAAGLKIIHNQTIAQLTEQKENQT